MAQNFSLGPGGPLQPQSGIVTNRFAPTTTGSQQLQDILRWLDAYKNRPNFVLGEAGDLLPKYSTGKNPLVPYQGGPNFQLGQGGPLRKPTNPKNIIPLLEDKLGKVPMIEDKLGKNMSRKIELDKLYPNGSKIEDFVKGLDTSFKGKAKRNVAGAIAKSGVLPTLTKYNVPLAIGTTVAPFLTKGIYNTLVTSPRERVDEILTPTDDPMADFNRFMEAQPGLANSRSEFIRRMGIPGLNQETIDAYLGVSGNTPKDTLGAIDVKESRPKANKGGSKQTNVNQYQVDPTTGLPILPEEAIDWDTKDNNLTQPPAQNKAVGYTQPVQQTLQQPQQPQPSGRTIEDIVALAQSQQQLRNEQMAPYIEALQEAMEKYGEGQNKNFFRDLGLAGLTGLTNNQAYAKMIGGYDENKPMEKRLALQQQLAGLKQQQLFDPTQIYGNAELVQRLGLSPEAALANPDVLKQYANIYNYGLDYNAVLARLQQQEQQNALDRALKWEMHMNPQYNTLASQAQLGSSILSNMQFSPALRESMTPEMIQYLISLTGFKPGSAPTTSQQPPQKQLVDDIIDYNASLRGR